MKRHLLITLVCFLLLFVAACAGAVTTEVAPTAEPAEATPLPPTDMPAPAGEPVLEIVTAEGSQSFTLDELKALPAVEGQAGIKSSTGKITPPSTFKGVLISQLLEPLGGLAPTMGVQVEAEDGYAMTLSADQISQGDFITYDPATGDEVTDAGKLQVLLAYEMDGQPLDVQRDGTLRMVVISQKPDQVTDGHWSVKWVSKITLKPLAQEWGLTLEGAIDDVVDRGSFESCSTSKCHGASYEDDKAQTWTGTPLWWIVGRVDNEARHDTGSFDKALAEGSYTIEVVAKDGYSVTFDSKRVAYNNDIIMAFAVNGNPLTDKDFPLRLVGADVSKKEGISAIDKIILHLDQPFVGADAPVEPTKEPVAVVEVTPDPNAALTMGGLVDAPLSWTRDALETLEVVKVNVEHPKKGAMEAEGVRLSQLLELVKPQSGATKLVFTAADGYTAEVDLAAVQACADCMVAFDESGSLKAVMPGLESGLWVKDLILIAVK